MRRLATVSVVLAAGWVGVALADNPKVIEVPLPPEDPVPDTEAAIPQVVVPVEPTQGGGRGDRGKVRREQRKVEGEPPTALFGVWTVVQITDLGETEDYKLKMERAGKALDEDCFVTDTWFDFGPPPTVAGLPAEITVTQVQHCEKGGLGEFANETAITTAAHWETQGGVEMELPEVRVDERLIRLRIAEDPGRTPTNRVGPEVRVDRTKVRFQVFAEYPPRRKGEGRPQALHLKGSDGQVWHLEPLGGEG